MRYCFPNKFQDELELHDEIIMLKTIKSVRAALLPLLTVTLFGFTPLLCADTMYVVTEDGNSENYLLEKIVAGTTTTLADLTGVVQMPRQMVTDSLGNLFLADQSGGQIEKITPSGVTSTFASGLASPFGLAIDHNNNLFVGTDTGIQKITAGGVVSTYSSNANVADGNSLAIDTTGNLFVLTSIHGVEKIATNGTVSYFAGNAGYQSLAFNSAGDLFGLAVSGAIKEIATNGVALSSGPTNVVTGLPSTQTMAADKNGNLFVLNFGNYTPNSGSVFEFAADTYVETPVAAGLNNDMSLALFTDSNLLPSTAIPEPSMLALFILGALIYIWYRHQQADAAVSTLSAAGQKPSVMT